MKKIFILWLIPVFLACKCEDGCIEYDDAIETIFWIPVADDSLYYRFHSGQYNSIAGKVPIETQNGFATIVVLLDDDTLCSSIPFGNGRFDVLQKYDAKKNSLFSMVQFSCRVGKHCNGIRSFQNRILKVHVEATDSSGTTVVSCSSSVNAGYAYGFILAEDFPRINSDISRLDENAVDADCSENFCSFSYRKKHLLCRESSLGDKCFSEE